MHDGATGHSATVQALTDDLVKRGLDPEVPRLFIIDGYRGAADRGGLRTAARSRRRWRSSGGASSGTAVERTAGVVVADGTRERS